MSTTGALTHGRVYNKFGPIRYNFFATPSALHPNGINENHGKNGLGAWQHPLTSYLGLGIKPGPMPQTRTRALTSGTVGSSAASKRAWARRARYSAQGEVKTAATRNTPLLFNNPGCPGPGGGGDNPV